MKRFIYLLMSAAISFWLVSCQREISLPDEVPVRYATMKVSVGSAVEGDVPESGDTKSLITTEAEKFRKAVLFAMDPSTGKVCVYGSNAGDLEGEPVIAVTEEKSFNWALPLERAIDIYALVNYGSMDVDGLVSKKGKLTVADLETLVFTCASSNELAALESSDVGLPMSSVTHVSNTAIKTGEEEISIKVKKLFARYNLYLDLSELAATSTSVVAESAVIYNMNNTVHYFTEGDKKSGSVVDSKMYDRATEHQLEILQTGSNENQVVFYVLENMQGDIAGASSWQTVYKDLGVKVKDCTYLNLSVNLVNAKGRAESRQYRIYLGKSDMKSNFDVPRNFEKTLKLKIHDGIEDILVDSFQWTDSKHVMDYDVLSVAQEESIRLHFVSNLAEDDIDYVVFDVATEAVVHNSNYRIENKSYDTSTGFGYVDFIPSNSLNLGTKVRIRGGSETAYADRVLSIQDAFSLEARVLHKADYFGEWSLFEIDRDVFDYYGYISCRIDGISNGVETKLIEYGQSVDDDICFFSETAALSRDGVRGTMVDLNHAKIAFCYSDKEGDGDLRVFIYLGDNTFPEYKVTFFSTVSGQVIAEQSFTYSPKMPVIILDGCNAQNQLYVDRESDKYLHLLDSDSKQDVTRRFRWFGCYDTLTNTYYHWPEYKIAGQSGTYVLFDFLRGYPQSGYDTIQKVMSYYNSQNWVYEDYLLDYLSAGYDIDVTSTRCSVTLFDETQGSLPGLRFGAGAWSNPGFNDGNFAVIKPTSYQSLFTDELKVYLKYKGKRTIDDEILVIPTFVHEYLVSYPTNIDRYYLSVYLQNHKAKTDLNIVIKYKGQNYTFDIKEGKSKSDTKYLISLDVEGDMESWQGISISPSLLTENMDDENFYYVLRTHYMFGDAGTDYWTTDLDYWDNKFKDIVEYNIDFYPDSYWRLESKGASWWILASPLLVLGPGGWMLYAGWSEKVGMAYSGIYGMTISTTDANNLFENLSYNGRDNYITSSTLGSLNFTDVFSAIIYVEYDDDGNQIGGVKSYQITANPTNSFWWNDIVDSNGRDQVGELALDDYSFELYLANGNVDTRPKRQFKGFNFGSEKYVPIGVIFKEAYRNSVVNVNLITPATGVEYIE